jgi:rhodanese-related sulfurtransferase
VPGAVNIPNRELRQRAAELDPSVEYRAVCNLGKTSYFASRTLTQSGLLASSLVGGLRLHMKSTPSPPSPPVATTSTAAAVPSRL